MSNDRQRKERQELEYESAREWAKRQETGLGRTSLIVPDGVGMFSVKKAGNYYIDVIPYTVGKGNPDCGEGRVFWTRTYWTHRGIGPGNDTYCCPLKCTGGKSRCPVCADVDRRFRELSTDLEGDALKKARSAIASQGAKMRQLMNVIDLNAPEKGIQVWDISYHLFGKSLKNMLDNMDDDEDFDRFFYHNKGKTLKITATEESGGGFSFYDCSSISFKERKKQYEKSIVEESHCLDAMLKILSYEDLLRVFLQIPDDEPLPDVDQDGRRSVSSSARASRGNGKPVDDDEDDLPVVKRPKKAAVPDDDDDEDAPPPTRKPAAVADDDDDDDAPPPKKGGKPQTAEEAGLKVGQTVTYKGNPWKLIKVSRDGTSLTLQDLEDEDEKEYAVAPYDVQPAGKAKAAPPDDDEDEDDQDDEEDDAPPPPKKSKK